MSDIPSDLVELLERLAFYSSVPAGHKICFNAGTVITGAWGKGSFYRWWYEEKSENLVIRTDELLDDANTSLKSPKIQKYRSYIFRYLEDMRGAIGRLIRTYSAEPDVTSKLEIRLMKLLTILATMTEKEQKEVENVREQSSSQFKPGSWHSVSPGNIVMGLIESPSPPNFGEKTFPPPPSPSTPHVPLKEAENVDETSPLLYPQSKPIPIKKPPLDRDS